MQKYLQKLNLQKLNGHGPRVVSTSIGMLVANFLVALLVDQFKLELHPNVVASGSLLIAAGINFIVSKYNKTGG